MLARWASGATELGEWAWETSGQVVVILCEQRMPCSARGPVCCHQLGTQVPAVDVSWHVCSMHVSVTYI
jgi:hypothetical protein